MTRTSPTGDPREGSRRDRGFTLVELLVALAIGSMVLAGAYAAFWLVAGSARRLEAHAEVMQGVRTLVGALEADLRSAIPPREGEPVTERFEERRLLVRTVDGTLGRGAAEYVLEGTTLRRTFTPREGEPVTAAVAEGVAEWRLEGSAAEGTLARGGWPRAVHVEVRFAGERGGPGWRFERRIRVEAEAPATTGAGR